MQLYSFAPIPVGVLPWTAPDPRVTVVAKLTLRYGRDGFAIATDEPEPLCHAIPSLFGSAEELYHPGDFVPAKARCDVLLTGNAYAAMPLTAIGARIRIGAFEKRFFALAGERAAAIPLACAYLRSKRRFDAEVVTVGARSAIHPERSRFANVTAKAEGTPPPGFDFSFFNAAPEDQQIDPVGPGTPISLEGLSPDGAPVIGALPLEWPQICAIAADGRIVDVPLTCDAVWIDTDRQLCVLTLRGLWQPLPAVARVKRGASDASGRPIALTVSLSPWTSDRTPPRIADLTRAERGRALSPEDVADELDPADIEEIEPEPHEIETATRGPVDASAIEPSRFDEEATVIGPTAPKPLAQAPAVLDEPRVDPSPPPRALGLLGAMQLRHSRAAEIQMPALPTAGRRPATIPPPSAPRRPRTLPFPTAREALEASTPQTVSKPAFITSTPGATPSPAPKAAPGEPKRSQTLQIDPWAAGRDPLPQRWRAQPSGPPPAAPDPADLGPKRARTLDLLPGAPAGPSAPFPISPSAARTGHLDGESARARFLALKALRAEAVSTEPVERTVEPEDIEVASPQSPGIPAPLDDVPWAGTLPRRPTRQNNKPSPVIERVGLLPLDVDAAVQQAIWEGTATLQEILAKHNLDEVTWRDHLRRREEALRDEAEKGGASRATAERAALDRARRPAAPPEPELDLLQYAAIRARIDDDGDEEPRVLASHGVAKDIWDREHRAYRKRLREEPALAERFKAAVEEARRTPEMASTSAATGKKMIAKKYGPGAQGASASGSVRARAVSPSAEEKKSGAARRRPA